MYILMYFIQSELKKQIFFSDPVFLVSNEFRIEFSFMEVIYFIKVDLFVKLKSFTHAV